MSPFMKLPLEIRYKIYDCLNPFEAKIDAQHFRFTGAKGCYARSQLFYVNRSIRYEAMEHFFRCAQFYDNLNHRGPQHPDHLPAFRQRLSLPWWNSFIQHFELKINPSDLSIYRYYLFEPSDVREFQRCVGEWISSMRALRTLKLSFSYGEDVRENEKAVFTLFEYAWVAADVELVIKVSFFGSWRLSLDPPRIGDEKTWQRIGEYIRAPTAERREELKTIKDSDRASAEDKNKEIVDIGEDSDGEDFDAENSDGEHSD
ncbi:MAG: hypothetical protein M1820_004005 [Bogoriella megaspora]|nr:MAG: hypothetical protein M1820_004005 [Bogoriella megaspora]